MKHLYTITLLLFSVACTTSAQIKQFDPSQISCTDITTSEMREKANFWRNNPDSDLYIIANHKEILKREKKTADLGNPDAMLQYGSLAREMLFLISTREKAAENLVYIGGDDYYSDKVKNEVIESLTYIYLSSVPDSKIKGDATNMVEYIEQNTADVVVPELWLKQAKANAQLWKESCSK